MILEVLNNYYKNKECQMCSKQMTCRQCTGLVKFSQIKNYGEVERKEGKYNETE